MITHDLLTSLGFAQEDVESSFYQFKDTLLDFELHEGIIIVQFGSPHPDPTQFFRLITESDVRMFANSITSILDQEM